MTSTPSHARTQSALPPVITSKTCPSPGALLDQRLRSESPDSTTLDRFDASITHDLNGAMLVDLARTSEEVLHELAAPPKAVSPSRPALGSRFLSSLSSASPAAASLTRKGGQLHSRAKSLAAFVPRLNSGTSVASEKTQSTTNKLFGDLFSGESAPIRLGPPVSPTKEREESEFVMQYRSAFTERPGGVPRRRETGSPSVISATTTTRSSSWFTRKPTTTVPETQQPQDELATLNINAALFPHGSADPLDPASFNNLLMNATNLLRRMQAAYREKADYVSTMRPDMEASREEVEEAETRATHLKKQLEDMSRRAQEQETTMREMASELADERRKAHEAREALEAARTIRIVSNSTNGERDGTVRRRKRGSMSNASDSGFESDMESIFSSHSGMETSLSPPEVSSAPSFESRLGSGNERETAPERSNASGNRSEQRLGREGAAWATVDTLRIENGELKKQMQEMQETLQGCIELVSMVQGS